MPANALQQAATTPPLSVEELDFISGFGSQNAAEMMGLRPGQFDQFRPVARKIKTISHAGVCTIEPLTKEPLSLNYSLHRISPTCLNQSDSRATDETRIFTDGVFM